MAAITPGGQPLRPYRAPQGPTRSSRAARLARARARAKQRVRASAPTPTQTVAAAAGAAAVGGDDIYGENPTGLPEGVMAQPRTTWAGNPLPSPVETFPPGWDPLAGGTGDPYSDQAAALARLRALMGAQPLAPAPAGEPYAGPIERYPAPVGGGLVPLPQPQPGATGATRGGAYDRRLAMALYERMLRARGVRR